MHDVACEFACAAVRSKDVQKQLARTSLTEAYPLRTLAGLSFDPPVGAFKFLEGLPVC